MQNNLIVRLSNEIGNQLFMYASAYSISKELNRNFYIDDETAFLSKQNVSKFGLDLFNISSQIAPNSLKFKNSSGYLKRKFLLKTEILRSKKKFYIEKKNKDKITKYTNDYNTISFDKNSTPFADVLPLLPDNAGIVCLLYIICLNFFRVS